MKHEQRHSHATNGWWCKSMIRASPSWPTSPKALGAGTQNEFVLFLGYALGSLAETQSHLTAAYDRAYLNKDRYAELFREGSTVRKLTIAFIRSMVMPRGGVKTLGPKINWTNQTWEIFERVTGKRRPAMFESSRPPARTPVNDEPPV